MSVLSVAVTLIKTEYYETMIYAGGAVGAVIAAASMFLILKSASGQEPVSYKAIADNS